MTRWRVAPLSLCLLLIAVLCAPGSASALAVGDIAPLFNGPSTMGEVHLSDYLGEKHVVLAFYFADFTPV